MKQEMETSCLLEVDESDSSDTSDTKNYDCVSKSISYLKLIGSNILAFGLELCSSAGFAYIPPILMKNGFSNRAVAFITGLGSFISLILVPIIGHWSDKCQSRFGRRRPFMFVLGLLTIVSLLMMSYSHEIFSYYSIISPCYGLAAGVVLFDFSCQALMNPCKALIPDIFNSIKEQNLGFTIFSCMISLGGGFGYLITSVNWTSVFIGTYFGGQEKAVFSILSLLLLILLIINLGVAHEKPLVMNVLTVCSTLDKNSNDFIAKNDIQLKDDNVKMPKVQNGFKPDIGIINGKIDQASKHLFIKPINQKSFMLRTQFRFKAFANLVELQVRTFFQHICEKYFHMPPVLFHLFIAYLFGSMGVICHDLYYTDFVGQVIYKGRPQSDHESSAIHRYDEGVRMGSVGLLLHCLSSAIYAALLQRRLMDAFGTFTVYLMGISHFSLCMLGTAMTTSLTFVNIFSALSGVGFAVLTTIPYSLIAEYYNKKEIYYKSDNIRGVGEDMAVLDVAYILAQIIASLVLGSILQYTKSSSTYMGFAAICGGLASYFAFFVTFPS